MLTKQTQARLAWLAPVLFLLAVGLGVWIVFAHPPALLGIVLVGVAAIPVLWTLVSALWPARAERGCPACKAPTLERIDRNATVGLHCPACAWRDESASAWLLAEEEGPLEELVLAQRGRAHPQRVDRSRSSG